MPAFTFPSYKSSNLCMQSVLHPAVPVTLVKLLHSCFSTCKVGTVIGPSLCACPNQMRQGQKSTATRGPKHWTVVTLRGALGRVVGL